MSTLEGQRRAWLAEDPGDAKVDKQQLHTLNTKQIKNKARTEPQMSGEPEGSHRSLCEKGGKKAGSKYIMAEMF